MKQSSNTGLQEITAEKDDDSEDLGKKMAKYL